MSITKRMMEEDADRALRQIDAELAESARALANASLTERAMSPVRQQAEQDLMVVEQRVAELERKLIEAKTEREEIARWLRRLERYEPFDLEQVDYSLINAVAPGMPMSTAITAASILDGSWRHDNENTTPKPSGLFGVEMQGIQFLIQHGLIDQKKIPNDDTRMGRVNNAVLEHLMILGGRTSTADLVRYLRQDPGLFGALGIKPEATLSSYLSRDPRFVFERAMGGWRVRTPADSGWNGEGDHYGEDPEIV